ncbi:MAG: hypothetical protein ACK5X3_01460, partial [Pseudomonadota bacterium]
SLDCQDCWPNEADGGAQARQTSAEDLLRPACRGKPFHCDDYFSGLLDLDSPTFRKLHLQ